MPKTKKIILISNNFPPEIDGVGAYTFHLGEELAKEINVFYINRNTLKALEWSFKTFIKAFNKVKEINPNLISLQYVPYGFNKKGIPINLVVFWLFLRLCGFRLQITFHEISIAYDSKSLRQSIGAFSQKIVAKFLCKFSHNVFTSTMLYREMLEKYTKKVSLVSIGTNINPSEQINSCEKEMITCFANRLNLNILKAIAHIKSIGISLQVTALGKMGKKSKVNILNEIDRLGVFENISIKTDLSEDEFACKLSCGQIYLQIEPVNEIGNGGVALKSGALAAAMAFGKAIITTKGSGTDTDILVDKKLVLFCDDTAESIADAILTLYHQDQLRFKLIKESRSYHTNFATWSKIATAYKQIL